MKWYIVYTRHHHERAVYERLRQKGMEAYLPWAAIWRQGKGGPRQAMIPLFPRYIFVRCYLEMYTHLELITLPGVIRLLEDAQGQPLEVPEAEMRVLQQLSGAGVPLERGPYPSEGERVRVAQGTLQGIAGVLRAGAPATLLVPIPSLRASVAVAIGRARVVPFDDRGTDARQAASPQADD
ncbi:MAG: transcription termination/antitermination NusG family protein [Candidatus Entotheonellia bacterium]